MSLTELKEVLEATGLPVAYLAFKTAQQLPFIVYREVNTDNFFADNKVYKKCLYVDIELYTENKAIETEEIIETILFENEIAWNATDTHIEAEEMFQRVYEIKLIY